MAGGGRAWGRDRWRVHVRPAGRWRARHWCTIGAWGARSAPGAKFEAWEKKGKSEGQFGTKMVKVALIKAIGKTVKGPALLET